MFTVDYNQAEEFSTVKDGTYETVIEKFEESATPGGSEFIDVRLRIREDFEQPFKKNILFHRIWKSKDTGKYRPGTLQNWFKQAQVPQGTQLKTFEDVTNALVGKAIKATVKNETSEYQGKTYNNTNVKRIESSELPAISMSTPEIEDVDLPF